MIDDVIDEDFFEEAYERNRQDNPLKVLGWDVDRVNELLVKGVNAEEFVQLAEGELRSYSKLFHPDKQNDKLPNIFAEMSAALLEFSRDPITYAKSYVNTHNELVASIAKMEEEIQEHMRANKRIVFIRKPGYATSKATRLGKHITILTTDDYSIDGMSVEEIGVFEVQEDFTLTARRGEIPRAEWDEDGFDEGVHKVTYTEQAFLERLCSPLEVEFEQGCWFGTRYYDDKYGFADDKFDIDQFASESITTKDMVVMGFCKQIEDDINLTVDSKLALKAGSRDTMQDFLTIPANKLVNYLAKMSQSPSEHDSIIVARMGSKRVEYLISKHKVKSCAEV